MAPRPNTNPRRRLPPEIRKAARLLKRHLRPYPTLNILQTEPLRNLIRLHAALARLGRG